MKYESRTLALRKIYSASWNQRYERNPIYKLTAESKFIIEIVCVVHVERVPMDIYMNNISGRLKYCGM
jgi:hypothetical protein